MQFLANANTTDQNQVVWLGYSLDVWWWWCLCSDLARFRPGRRNSSLFFLLQLDMIIILRRKRGASLVRLLSPVVCKLQRHNPFNGSRSIVICICIPRRLRSIHPPTLVSFPSFFLNLKSVAMHSDCRMHSELFYYTSELELVNGLVEDKEEDKKKSCMQFRIKCNATGLSCFVFVKISIER